MRATAAMTQGPSSGASPIGFHERYEAIDLLRGVALLGILVMNIQMFAMPTAAYFNPTALGERGRVDFCIWVGSHLFFDQKFMTIFSWLFGAGIVLMTGRAADRGVKPAVFHYRRMLALLVFGLIHAYLIWDGDILVLYSICGAFVYPFRKLRPSILLGLGLLSLVIGSSVMVAAGVFLPQGSAEGMQEFQEFWAPTAEQLRRETLAFQGGWLAQMPVRTANSLEFELSDIWLWGLWRAGGNMLIGMALLKWRVVTAELPEKVYGALARIGFGFGLPCTLIFYGHGLGFYMHVSRPGQLAVTLAVWIMLLVAAPLWLARFRFGPLEWLWRTLTYGEGQPFRRERHSSRD